MLEQRNNNLRTSTTLAPMLGLKSIDIQNSKHNLILYLLVEAGRDIQKSNVHWSNSYGN